MSCTDITAVLTGGVGGVMGLIIVCQSVLIVILLQRKRAVTQTRSLCVTTITNEVECVYAEFKKGFM